LDRAAQEFESLFVQTLLKSMRSTVMNSDLIDNQGEMNTYKQMLDEEMADKIGGSGGLGIADMVARQFKPFLDGGGPPDTRQDPGPRPLEDPAAPVRVQDLAPVPTARPRLTAGRNFERALAAYGAEPVRPAPAATDSLLRLQRAAAAVGGDTATAVARFGADIDAAAQAEGVPPELVTAVLVRESAGRPEARSHAGARGLMQLMPDTAREVGVADIHDPAQNIRGGARYLARMLDRFDGDTRLALAAYNAGPGTVSRAGNAIPDYPETIRYVGKVEQLLDELLAGTDAGGVAPTEE
jgi:Rod binding domain-containing protein